MNRSISGLLKVTAGKAVYHEGDNTTITIGNISNLTVTFGSNAYGVSFEMVSIPRFGGFRVRHRINARR